LNKSHSSHHLSSKIKIFLPISTNGQEYVYNFLTYNYFAQAKSGTSFPACSPSQSAAADRFGTELGSQTLFDSETEFRGQCFLKQSATADWERVQNDGFPKPLYCFNNTNFFKTRQKSIKIEKFFRKGFLK